MNHCPQCEREIPPDSNFCHKCGKRIEQQTKDEARTNSESLSNAIDRCKNGTQKLINSTKKITGNVVQIQKTKKMDGELLSEIIGNMTTFLAGVKTVKRGIANIKEIQPNSTSVNDRNFSSEYIENAQNVVASSIRFFDTVDFTVKYRESGRDKSAKLSQLSAKKNLEAILRNVPDITLHGGQITHSAEELVNNCEKFIDIHNSMFGQSEYRI